MTTPREPQYPLDAACRGLKPDQLEAFFGDDGERRKPVPLRVQAAARRYCAHCPVRRECGDRADERRDEGLWGGVWRWRENNSTGAYQRHPLVSDDGTTTTTRPALPVRRHVKKLVNSGWTRVDIARAAGVHRDTVTALLAAESPRLHAAVADALLAVRGKAPAKEKASA
ncbi:WhiB family transcriptional regulator [Actinosynnema sp. NPDC059335]|uniref:WhiB family transcriptional regulator n=1 Tax=Actinosynnema sp. NPDC059335 TaxID=3346804 RepID=UPI00366F1BBC